MLGVGLKSTVSFFPLKKSLMHRQFYIGTPGIRNEECHIYLVPRKWMEKSILRLACVFPYNTGRCLEIYVTQMSPSLPASRSTLPFNAQIIVCALTGSPAFILSLSPLPSFSWDLWRPLPCSSNQSRLMLSVSTDCFLPHLRVMFKAGSHCSLLTHGCVPLQREGE